MKTSQTQELSQEEPELLASLQDVATHDLSSYRAGINQQLSTLAGHLHTVTDISTLKDVKSLLTSALSVISLLVIALLLHQSFNISTMRLHSRRKLGRFSRLELTCSVGPSPPPPVSPAIFSMFPLPQYNLLVKLRLYHNLHQGFLHGWCPTESTRAVLTHHNYVCVLGRFGSQPATA